MAKQKFELSSTYIIEVDFDGGGATIVAGSRTVRTIPFDCEIKGWTITCVDPWDIDVSILVSVRVYPYKDYPKTYRQAFGTKQLVINSASKNQGLVKWKGTLKKYNQLVFSVDAALGARHVVIALHIKSK